MLKVKVKVKKVEKRNSPRLNKRSLRKSKRRKLLLPVKLLKPLLLLLTIKIRRRRLLL